MNNPAEALAKLSRAYGAGVTRLPAPHALVLQVGSEPHAEGPRYPNAGYFQQRKPVVG